MKYVSDEFYCINCGNKGMNVLRNKGQMHKSGHLKKLYCIHCQMVCNHYECRTDEDVILFKKKYEAGEFKELAEQSINHCKKELF
jgi:hypothetical protein